MRLQFDEEAAYMEQYLREYIKEHHMQQSAVALEAAIRFHHGQKRTEGRPYIIHPMMLAMHGIALGVAKDDDDLLAVMLLHDVCEDCPVSPEELTVNEKVRQGVRCITKTRREGESKEEMMQETLLECSREFLDKLLTLVPSECVRISVVGPKAG